LIHSITDPKHCLPGGYLLLPGGFFGLLPGQLLGRLPGRLRLLLGGQTGLLGRHPPLLLLVKADPLFLLPPFRLSAMKEMVKFLKIMAGKSKKSTANC
jgi:hypothetical protein